MISFRYLIKFAFRNVLRNKRRTLLTMVVIMLSVGSILFLFSYIKGVLDSIIEDSIKLTGQLNIQHPEYSLKERMLSLSVPVENYSVLASAIRSVPDIDVATGRIKFGGLIDFHEKNEPGIGMAIEPSTEQDILQLHNSIISGRGFSESPEAKHETLIGTELASTLDIQPGDTITVISRTAFNSLTAENLIVVGIINLLSSALNRMFYVHIETGQSLLDMEDMVTEIAVFTKDGNDENAVKTALMELPEIKGKYNVVTWLEKGILKDYLPLINTVYFILTILFGTIAAFGIINTMLMAVFERTREIGVLSAFGMKPRNILFMFLIEALLIGCFGGILGVSIGGYWAYYLETYGLTFGKIVEGISIPIRQTIYADLRWWHIVISFGLGLGISVIAAIFPAFKAARMEPTNALRTY